MKNSPEHAGDIGINRRFRKFVGKARDRPGGVGSDAGQSPERHRVAWEDATVVCYHLTGQAVQIGGTAIVAESGPGLLHATGRSLGEVVDGGEVLEKATPVTFDARNRGLLEHHFGHEDVIWVAGATPGQVSTMATEPHHEATLDASALGRKIGEGLGLHHGTR